MEPAPRPAPRATHSILVIEDDPDNRFLLGERLRAELPDARVIVAESADAALELTTRTRPTVIVLDLHLHGMEGFELAARLRAEMPAVPIVLLTGDMRPEARERAEREGFAAFLTKPEGVDELPALIRRLSSP